MPLNGRNEVCQSALGVPAFPWINLTNGMLMAPREGAPNVTIIAKSCPTLLVAWNRSLTVVEMAQSTLLRRHRVGRPPATILARRRELTFSDFILIKAQQFEMKNRNAQEPIQNDNRRGELRKLWLQMLSKGPPTTVIDPFKLREKLCVFVWCLSLGSHREVTHRGTSRWDPELRHQTNTQRSWIEKCMQISKRMRTHLRGGSQELEMPVSLRSFR